MSNPILFADDISLIVATFDSRQLQEYFNIVIGKRMQQLQAISLTTNFNKTYCRYFKTIGRHIDNSPIKHMNAQIISTQNTDSLGVTLDST
jgi:hypothetical protein